MGLVFYCLSIFILHKLPSVYLRQPLIYCKIFGNLWYLMSKRRATWKYTTYTIQCCRTFILQRSFDTSIQHVGVAMFLVASVCFYIATHTTDKTHTLTLVLTLAAASLLAIPTNAYPVRWHYAWCYLAFTYLFPKPSE